MKVEQKVTPPKFDPITITIESLDELKWMIAIANTSVTQARSQTQGLGFVICNDFGRQQMVLFNALSEYQGLIV